MTKLLVPALLLASLGTGARAAQAPAVPIPAAYPLLTNVPNRPAQSLDGPWRTIVDPMENGYYRYVPTPNGYFKNQKPKDKSELVE